MKDLKDLKDTCKNKSGRTCTATQAFACDWSIDSKEHGDCFWIYVEALSSECGELPPISQSEMVCLLGIKPCEVASSLDNAMGEVVASLKRMDGAGWAEDLTNNGFENLPKMTDGTGVDII